MQFINPARQGATLEVHTSGGRGRRIKPQKLSDRRAGLVVAERDYGFDRTERKSDHRASLRPQRTMALGETLTWEPVEGAAVAGQVIWNSGFDCGEVLAGPVLWLQSGNDRRDNSAASSSAVTHDPTGKSIDIAADKSRSEVKPVHDGSFVDGLAVKVLMASGPDRRGVVCWTDANIARLIVLDQIAGDLGSPRACLRN